MRLKNKTVRLAAWGGASALLLVPLMAMQVTDDVDWTLFDFAFGAVLIALAGVAIELVLRWTSARVARLAGVVAVLSLFALVWGALAVG